MTSSNFLIGPMKDSLRKDARPWATPEDSFTEMTNAYQYRGRIVKRSGYTLLGRLSPDGLTFPGNPVMGLKTLEGFAIGVQTTVGFDTTSAYSWNGNNFVTLPSVMPVTWSGTDSQFFWTTNYAAAFWATNSKPGLNGFVVSGVAPGVGFSTITTLLPNGFTTGQTVTFINVGGVTNINGLSFVITVTGPTTFTIPIVTTGAFTTGGLALNSQVTVAGQDGIRYYGILENGTGWANYNPPIDTVNALAGALMIFPYRGYLVFLNTSEGNDQGINNFGNRARWTQIGTPYYSHPVPQNPNLQGVDINAVRDDLFGRGGANDAPTNEVIVGAGFIRDILVVYFERSTWRLRFVNNAQNPFVWERVNIELGSDCTFSTIPFDKGLMAIGNRGIVISDGNDTIRFDEKIPNEIFNIRQENNGFSRVQGIRTFQTRLNYWTYPSSLNPLGIYPDKVLVFNYDTKNWSFFDDTFTTFGYHYETGTGLTWNDLPNAWADTHETWDGGFAEVGYENIIAGNQQGYVFVLEATNGGNAPSLSISSITVATPGVFTSVNHNLKDGDWIKLSGVTGTTSSDGVSLNNRNFKLNYLTSNTFTLSEFQSIPAGNASGTSYTYTISYTDLIPGSIQINIGALVFTDPNVDGNLVEAANLGSGTINYSSGLINITFNPAIGSTAVNIRIVSYDPLQQITPITTLTAYTGGGQIAKISSIDIETKFFNFFNEDQRARLSKIDFYLDSTSNGQFTCNVFADSGNSPANAPLKDNRQSNIVLTSTNPYQIGQGDETIFRLYADVLAQTIQLQLTYSDQQQAVDAISQEDIQLLAMMFTMRKGGRVV